MAQPITAESLALTLQQFMQVSQQNQENLQTQLAQSQQTTGAKIEKLAEIIEKSNAETNASIQKMGGMLTEQMQDLGVKVDNVTEQVGHLSRDVQQLVQVLSPQQVVQEQTKPNQEESKQNLQVQQNPILSVQDTTSLQSVGTSSLMQGQAVNIEDIQESQ
uniref:Uncharacterized protein n=1 Tax=Candidatus Kentrum sp. SD TaxID=2126332 RepID=A0A451BRT4_9GAMM|nr:MAG: hypothetical protein BECKSD772F_GA0070984_12355 [Candidatus Kentron sp. SD]VFK49721.1 MAG: hypothetical protein BECKSD772E_GA0070983_12232 [Candidatus Kentron sp. SD]VFK80968.1 MAG: hypothetical protein BECKSD772D_GA0070982_11875 [Candidatus Kentron sp. SD]